MSKDIFLTLRGRLYWAKIVGPARPHTGLPKYDKGPNWSLDLIPDANSRRILADHGLDKGGSRGTGKLRNPTKSDKETRTETFISLKHLENNEHSPTGKNEPPKIVDIRGHRWDGGEIGNETVADVKVKVKDYGPGSEMGMYLQAVRILSHVPYVREEFDEISEEDEYFAAAEQAENEDPNSFADAEPFKVQPVKAEDPADAKDEDLNDEVPY